jgi:NAD(P)-dependent dehydrogenase (short-subunit alcohol dehydrogenase family)
MKLDGRAAIVTGGGGGMGLAAAQAIGGRGARGSGGRPAGKVGAQADRERIGSSRPIS